MTQSPGEPHNDVRTRFCSDHRPLAAFVWLSRAKVKEREREMGDSEKKRAWDGVVRPTSQLVKWSNCRSQDAGLTAFCRIEGATSNRKRRGAGERGVRVVH